MFTQKLCENECLVKIALTINACSKVGMCNLILGRKFTQNQQLIDISRKIDG